MSNTVYARASEQYTRQPYYDVSIDRFKKAVQLDNVD